jgi:hypothetical protein
MNTDRTSVTQPTTRENDMNRIARALAAVTGLLAALTVAPALAQSTVAAVQPASAAAPSTSTSLEIALGETKTGTLTAADPQLDDGEHYHKYTFIGTAGDRIVVSLRSSSFDSYLAMLTSTGEWDEQDDDSGGGSSAKLDVTLPNTGRYFILVTSYEGGKTGAYTLAVRAHDATSEPDPDEWTLYAQTSDVEAQLYYLPSSIRRKTDTSLEVWTRWVYPELQPASEGGAPYDHEKRLVRVDCRTERLGIVSFVEYAGEKTVNAQTADDVDMIPAVPGSVGESLLRRVCTPDS